MQFKIKRNFSEPIMEYLIAGVNLWVNENSYNNTLNIKNFIEPIKLWEKAINISKSKYEEMQLVCDELSEKYACLECELVRRNIALQFMLFEGVNQNAEGVSKDVIKLRYEKMQVLERIAQENGCVLNLVGWDVLRKDIANIIIYSLTDGFIRLLPFTVDFFQYQYNNKFYDIATKFIESDIKEFFQFIDNRLDGYELLMRKIISIYKMCVLSYTDIKKEILTVQKSYILQNEEYDKYTDNNFLLNSHKIVEAFSRIRSDYKKLQRENLGIYCEKQDSLAKKIYNISMKAEMPR